MAHVGSGTSDLGNGTKYLHGESSEPDTREPQIHTSQGHCHLGDCCTPVASSMHDCGDSLLFCLETLYQSAPQHTNGGTGDWDHGRGRRDQGRGGCVLVGSSVCIHSLNALFLKDEVYCLLDPLPNPWRRSGWVVSDCPVVRCPAPRTGMSHRPVHMQGTRSDVSSHLLRA